MVKTALLSIMIVVLLACESQVKQAKTAYKSEFSELIAIKGHDPVEEGVLNIPFLKHRLVKMMGEGKYDTLVQIMHECTPIGFNNDVVYWMGYSKENPEATGAAILIDLNEDIIYVGYEFDHIIERFSEAGNVMENPNRLQMWLNRRDRIMPRAPEPIIPEESDPEEESVAEEES